MTPSETKPVLVEIRNLTIRRHGEAILEDVAIDVARSSAHVVVGRNGAGKSTTFNLITGVLPTTGGSVRAALMPWFNDAGVAGWVMAVERGPRDHSSVLLWPTVIGGALAAGNACGGRMRG